LGLQSALSPTKERVRLKATDARRAEATGHFDVRSQGDGDWRTSSITLDSGDSCCAEIWLEFSRWCHESA
jgi:hypothetical protein